MLRHSWLIVISAWLALTPGVSSAAGSSEVWLSGVPPFVREQTFHEADSDYMDLFKPDAPWPKSAQVVKVFMINGALVMHQSGEELKAVFSDLKRRNILLAIEMGLLSGQDSAGQQVCGVGVEGFAAPDNAKVVADRIQKAGGVLAYVAMDEPLWYARHFSGKNACGWTMEDVARDIVPRVDYRRQQRIEMARQTRFERVTSTPAGGTLSQAEKRSESQGAAACYGRA
jgi:hypothetical protein